MDFKQKKGFFVISLDFELFWGMLDKTDIAHYGTRIRGERTAIPRMLALFKKYGIHATWGTVGMLMARNKTELLRFLPPHEKEPTYSPQEASSYDYIRTQTIEETDTHFFGDDLVAHIQKTPYQEIGNHTFSHFYPLDVTNDLETTFSEDLRAYANIAEARVVFATSIIFPRNQYNDTTLRICHDHGITAYRGNENHLLYKPRKDREQNLLIRGLRLLDHYINLSGHHTYNLPKKANGIPLNIPASRFFRPWSSLLRFFEPFRIRRIKNSMTYAAKHGEVFHLWWHPHNVSVDQEHNFKNLEILLRHFTYLQEKYSMESVSMGDITKYSDEFAV